MNMTRWLTHLDPLTLALLVVYVVAVAVLVASIAIDLARELRRLVRARRVGRELRLEKQAYREFRGGKDVA